MARDMMTYIIPGHRFVIVLLEMYIKYTFLVQCTKSSKLQSLCEQRYTLYNVYETILSTVKSQTIGSNGELNIEYWPINSVTSLFHKPLNNYVCKQQCNVFHVYLYYPFDFSYL